MKIPKRIWLQVEDANELIEATWCPEQINDSDVAFDVSVIPDESIPNVCPTCGAAIDREASYKGVLVAKSRKEPDG